MSNKDNRLIIVLGMHRSGTSAITKSLELLGVGLGSNLHPAGFDNPQGFWEDKECIEINESLLKHLGSAYDHLDFGWDEIAHDAQIAELKTKAIQLISRKLSENNGIWGFKDPRTCRLLGFWKNVFSALECQVSFVIAVRNPASVAASLFARNKIPAEKSYFLWLQHVLPPLNFMPTARRIVVDYDELLAHPYAQIVRMATSLGLPAPDPQSLSVKNFEGNFLQNKLRHANFTQADLAQDSRAPSMVAATYAMLHRLAKDQESLDSANMKLMLEELSGRLKDVVPALNYVNVLEDERAVLWNGLAERSSQIASLIQATNEREGRVAQLTQVVAERERRIAQLTQVVVNARD